MKNRDIVIGGTFLGLVVGAVAGYFTAKYKLEEKYAAFASDEIAQAKVYLGELYKDRIKTPADALKEVEESPPADDETLRRVIKGLRYAPPGVVVQEVPKIVNIFDGRDDSDSDFHEEEPEDGSPHVISLAEYTAGEKNYTQVSLTYYAADEVLVEDGDIPVENHDMLVGIANLDKFGHRSRDPKVVYVRNDKLQIDYEICKSEGSFAEEVHGIIQPREPKVRKMRRE